MNIEQWTDEEKNIFFDKLMNREIEGLSSYYGTAGFFSVKHFMETKMAEVWDIYLRNVHLMG